SSDFEELVTPDTNLHTKVHPSPDTKLDKRLDAQAHAIANHGSDSESGPKSEPSFDAVQAAHRRIAPHIHRTPVMTSSSLDAIAGARLYFKCENLQRAG